MAELLRGQLERERERADKAEAAAAALPELRACLGRAEGESGALREQVAIERARADRLELERDAAREELDYWTAGGPLARAVRVLLYRRGRP